jgi:hypothetical protein
MNYHLNLGVIKRLTSQAQARNNIQMAPRLEIIHPCSLPLFEKNKHFHWRRCVYVRSGDWAVESVFASLLVHSM